MWHCYCSETVLNQHGIALRFGFQCDMCMGSEMNLYPVVYSSSSRANVMFLLCVSNERYNEL